MELTNENVLGKLIAQFGEENIFDAYDPDGIMTLTTTRENIIALIQYLYDDKDLQVQFLTTMAGIHFPDHKGRELCMMYQLHSLRHNYRLRIKVFVPAEDPVLPTLTNIYAAANWMEREAYDFYGFIFTGHPNLIRILNIEEMEYHPMLKQYPLEDQTREDKIDTYFGR
ncbi:NADH-quinone oxidoreductase subunit C [Pontibacter sp. BT731]|uniref:NADH-quinone oxidoreductase subunit C n=1 Tax=Pontibacter TaxID=323449 RepID=UPI0020A1E79C|nr:MULTISPECIES: NADH-quinone oxidoreductase subunit C [unclassified Pontibacter]MCP2043300.1 NADH-quinone oxidoreductase subunit C [Pontibacter sp. HSC-36F09]MDO6392037.1 NADH-quinone oxidoreductase subunit C [Pontibacter sp. BT731]